MHLIWEIKILFPMRSGIHVVKFATLTRGQQHLSYVSICVHNHSDLARVCFCTHFFPGAFFSINHFPACFPGNQYSDVCHLRSILPVLDLHENHCMCSFESGVLRSTCLQDVPKMAAAIIHFFPSVIFLKMGLCNTFPPEQ